MMNDVLLLLINRPVFNNIHALNWPNECDALLMLLDHDVMCSFSLQIHIYVHISS